MTVTQGSRAKGMAKIQGATQARSRESPFQTSNTLARGPVSTQASPVTRRATPVPWAPGRDQHKDQSAGP